MPLTARNIRPLKGAIVSNLAKFIDAMPCFAYVAESIGYVSLCSGDDAWSHATTDVGSGVSSHWMACAMTRQQQRVIFDVCTKRGHLMRPLPTSWAGVCVWCHAHAVGEQARPNINWTRADNGDWCYESSTGSIVATVQPSGTLVGFAWSREAIGNDFDWSKADQRG